MGGPLVTVLTLLILDLVVTFRILKPPILIDKHIEFLSKLSHSLSTENVEKNTENVEENTEVPNPTLTDDENSTQENNIHETCNDENGCEEQMPGRSLKVGDTFTPQEMLPIAMELLNKVEKPGEGKGIVSSVRNPQVLADVLFENYFMTTKRIVTLQANDISGLDALQALSLSGKKLNLDASVSITVAPTKIFGENSLNSSKIGSSKYKVLTKHKMKFGPSGMSLIKAKWNRRFSIRELADKTLAKKRKLVVKARRARRNQTLKTKKRVSKDRKPADKTKKTKLAIKARRARRNQTLKTKKRVSKVRQGAGKTVAKKRKSVIKAERVKRNRKLRVPKSKKPVPKSNKRKRKTAVRNTKDASNNNKVCRWRYLCTDPADQRTCHVYPDCLTNDKNDKYIGERNDKNAKTLEKFRRMISIEPIDEEVGKIVERHALSIKAQEADALKIETIGEYFDKLMKRESMKDKSSTKAMLRRPIK